VLDVSPKELSSPSYEQAVNSQIDESVRFTTATYLPGHGNDTSISIYTHTHARKHTQYICGICHGVKIKLCESNGMNDK